MQPHGVSAFDVVRPPPASGKLSVCTYGGRSARRLLDPLSTTRTQAWPGYGFDLLEGQDPRSSRALFLCSALFLVPPRNFCFFQQQQRKPTETSVVAVHLPYSSRFMKMRRTTALHSTLCGSKLQQCHYAHQDTCVQNCLT